jgi:hypothetical protein
MFFTADDIRIKLLTAVAPLGCVRDIEVKPGDDYSYDVGVVMVCGRVVNRFSYGLDLRFDTPHRFASWVEWTYGLWRDVMLQEAYISTMRFGCCR